MIVMKFVCFSDVSGENCLKAKPPTFSGAMEKNSPPEVEPEVMDAEGKHDYIQYVCLVLVLCHLSYSTWLCLCNESTTWFCTKYRICSKALCCVLSVVIWCTTFGCVMWWCW